MKFRVGLIRLLALCAAGVSAYLFWVSFTTAGLPAGCGASSACASVLSSRWGGVFGVPVSAPALVVWIIAIAACFCVGAESPLRRRIAWSVLTCTGLLIAIAAIWFIILQVFIIRAICPWCLADHVLGLMFAMLVLLTAPIRSRTLRHVGLAAFLFAMLVAGQLLVEYKPAKVQRLPAGINADSGPGADRTIQILNGGLQLAVAEVPLIGSLDAPHVLVVLFDYCCPHCQATHGYLLNVMAKHLEQIALIALPMPMNHECNHTLHETESRFEHSCQLSRLALAVWRVNPKAFVEFDSWLFESDMPRELADATRQAETLVTVRSLQTALTDPWIDQQIARNVEAYVISNAERIPVIMSPKMDGIIGRPEDAEELLRLLEEGLHLRVP